MSSSLPPKFSSRSLMISGFAFKSLTHFDFTFLYGVRQWSYFILLHVAVKFSQYNLLKTLPILYYIVLATYT